MLRAEELCQGEERGASDCSAANTVKCVACEFRWQPDSGDVNDPGLCPQCHQFASVAERCASCPVIEVGYFRSNTATGQMLERVLDHDFDCKHYRIDPGDVNFEVREGLKTLESERGRWERETREKQRQEFEDRQRVLELQRKQQRQGGF